MYHKSHFTSQKISRRLALIEPLVYRRRKPLPPFRFLNLGGLLTSPPAGSQVDDSSGEQVQPSESWAGRMANFTLREDFQVPLDKPLAEPPVGLDVDDSAWEQIKPYDYWSSWLADFMLRTHFQVPASWPKDAPLAVFLPLGEAGDFSHPEALAYVDGVSYSSCDRHHQEIKLPASLNDGKDHLLALHGWTGLMEGNPHGRLQMKECALVQIDQPTRDFIALGRVALGIADVLGENDLAHGQLLTALDEAFKVLDTREPFGEGFYASVPQALDVLRRGVKDCGPSLNVDITAAGHAHIDVAWLWVLRQTRRKAGRTFHNALRMMEQFPDFVYAQSQPQLYDFVRHDYPDLFKQIQQRVAEGRWETLGGMWVEADCNVTGPESLARQFLLGRAFFRKYFGGIDSPVLWLPDVFGYAWNLPQLIKEAGMQYFFTIKIGWSQYNRLPYDSFWWQGLDGTKVLTHFSTTPEAGSAWASTYNANVAPAQVMGTWTNFLQKDAGHPGLAAPLLMAFGYGDGGGGPTREMLENLREMGNFPSTPRIHPGKVGDFFRRLESQAGDALPTWNAELYLEIHRGTYTTQARNKRANRQSEFLLHDAEFLASLASTLDPAYAYPHDALRQAWQVVCLNQFHDILPGSSIGPVYVESQQQYAQVRQAAETVRDGALAAIAGHTGGEALLVNPISFTRRDLAFWPDGNGREGSQTLSYKRAGGSPVVVQAVEGGLLLDAGELAPFSVMPLQKNVGEGLRPPPTRGDENLVVSPSLLENAFVRIELDPAGDISRIYDKRSGREVLPDGKVANQFQAFEDRPRDFDAWDVDITYDDKMWLAESAESVRVVESGPLRATLEERRRILNSPYVQRISLCHNSPRLDISTTIQWQERHILLKTAFPVDVLAPAATYEIQWGNVQRPTHRNTSWDWARFETCAQKWVDLSEGGYGASLLNTGKYGHDIRNNVMRISLLRSPTTPDFEADQGEQRFTYSFLPHACGWNETTVAEAYALNDPLIVWANPAPAPMPATAVTALVSCDLPNLVIETIKQAEDGCGIIVRLYETQRKRGQTTLTAAFPVAQAWRTNLLEEDQHVLEVDGKQVKVPVKPYQIVTVRLMIGD
jgi:alpha-mannosidase